VRDLQPVDVMNWLALFAAVVCAVVALVYALPMIAGGLMMRFVRRRTKLAPPLPILAFLRVPWTPVLLWGAAALIFAFIAFGG
jgi:hypothetical protein